MTILVNLVLLTLMVASLIAAGVYFFRGLQSRLSVGAQPYGYGQQEARKQTAFNLLRGGIGVVVALVFLIALVIFQRNGDDAGTAETATATPPPALTAELTETRTPTSTATPVVEITPTGPLPTLTPSPTPSVTPTPSATPLPTGTVNSPNGLYLRDVPGGTAELELIPDGATVTLLGQTDEANNLTWVRVRTAAGNDGWVALDFLIVESP